MKNEIILLVEDNADDVRQTLRSFARNSIANQVVVAKDGAQALDYLYGEGAFARRDTAIQPGLVLLDLKLPRVSGFDVLRRMRADPRTRAIPVIVLTSSWLEEDRLQSYELGANVFCRKPVQFAEFLNAARYLGLYWTLVGSGLALLHGDPGAARAYVDATALHPQGTSPEARPLQVLLASADATATRLVAELLTAEGHTVTIATDSRGAFRHLLAGLPDVLVADAQLPDLSGIEIVRSLRRSPVARAVHTILVSADVFRTRAEIDDDDVHVMPRPLDALGLADHLRSLKVAELVRDLSEPPGTPIPAILGSLPPPSLGALPPPEQPAPPRVSTPAPDPWTLLGIPRDASRDAVERAVDTLAAQLSWRATHAETPEARANASALAERVVRARAALVSLCLSGPVTSPPGGSSSPRP